MERELRIHYPGALYYATLCGNGEEGLFVDDEGRQRFEALIAAGVERFKHRIHAYCWTANHALLVIQVAEPPLVSIIQDLVFGYAAEESRRHQRQGHFFPLRQRALLVNGACLLDAVRRIHLHPVHTGLAADPGAYPWSGHVAYLGKREVAWLTTDEVLSRFAADKAIARCQYERYVLAGMKQTV